MSGIKVIAGTIGNSIISVIQDVQLIFGVFAKNIESVARQSMDGFRRGIIDASESIFSGVKTVIIGVDHLFNDFGKAFDGVSSIIE